MLLSYSDISSKRAIFLTLCFKNFFVYAIEFDWHTNAWLESLNWQQLSNDQELIFTKNWLRAGFVDMSPLF